MSRALVILKMGYTFPELAEEVGDFEDWVSLGLGLPDETVQVIDARGGGDLPAASDTVAVVTTGSHDMVTDRPRWSERAAEWLQELTAQQVPVLGICYGHQLLAQSFGGRVGDNPKGREVGMVTVTCQPDGGRDIIIGTLPPTFKAHSSHTQSVLELPPGAVRLATTDMDENHAFRIGSYTWGIQFHPEFSPSVMRRYIQEQKEVLIGQGRDYQELIMSATDSPAARLLHSFGHWAWFRLTAQMIP